MDRIQLLINQCNQLIERINTNKFYSFYEIIQFNDDALTNLHSDTQIDFLDCGLIFSKEQFQSKGNVFPDWKELFTSFMINFPMFVRVKHIEETDDQSKIITRYSLSNLKL